MTCLLREIDESREMAKVVEKMKLKKWMDEERKKLFQEFGRIVASSMLTS